jgi:peptidoglycan/LPS O-acetylase OafA/YrhL
MRPDHLHYIDSLRGWAILMVVACHQALYFNGLAPPLSLLASYGQTGVFLFFVVSAFTLGNSAFTRQDESNPTRNFFIRRYFRIAPLYYMGVALYVTLQLLFPDLMAQFLREPTTLDVLTNLTLTHGLTPSTFTGLVPGGWSIGTEWVFYLLFPLLFAAFIKAQQRFGWKALLVPTGVAVVIGALNLAHRDMSTNLYWFWYDSILNQLPVFMTGLLLFFAIREGRFAPDLRRDVPLFLLISAGGIWLLSQGAFIALPFVSALSFVFLFNALRCTKRSFIWVEHIGRVSYSMYVLHFIFVALAAKVIAALLPAEESAGNLAFAIALPLSILATYLLAKASERYVERRFIAYGRTLTQPPRALAEA